MSHLPPCKTMLPGSLCRPCHKHGDTGAPPQMSPQRCRSPQKAMSQPWGEHGHVSSTSEGDGPCLQDARSHWVSVASHFPAARGRGGRRTSFLPPWRAELSPNTCSGEQVMLQTHSGKAAPSCIQGKVVPAPSHWNCWLLVRFSHPVELQGGMLPLQELQQ